MSLSADLDTKLVDVTRMSLATLRALGEPMSLDAVRRLVETIPLSELDEIQEPGQKAWRDSTFS